MKIIIATDAWEPQMNGVARTLKQTQLHLEKMGHEVKFIHPSLFNCIKCPFTHDVKLAYGIKNKFISEIVKRPCAVHIATEGPIGLSLRKYCIKNNIPFTTAYHTKHPEFMKKLANIPIWITSSYLRWFHNPSEAVMATTHSMIESIQELGVKSPIKLWTRGVDINLFYPREKTLKIGRPVGLYVGRISKEKSIEDFLSVDCDIEKIVVGDGPELSNLKSLYPKVHFFGPLFGQALAQVYANADVFVFPSKSDTFGLVVLESLASGVPVACYPVEGPGEIIGNTPGIGNTSWDLKEAIEKSLETYSLQACLDHARKYSWEACTQQFFENLAR